jgi:predicted DNA binding protein
MVDVWQKPYHIVIEVENKDCKMLKKFSSLGLKNLKVTDLRSSSSGSVKHLIELSSDQVKHIPSDFGGSSRKESKLQGKQAIWFESEGCEVCNSILANDAFLIAGKSVEENRIMYSFMVPTFEAYAEAVRTLKSKGHNVNVLKMGRFEPKIDVLTENQETVFWLALKSGFFDFPRKVGIRELSNKLGVKPSTLSEVLRRGTRRLLENYFKEEISK